MSDPTARPMIYEYMNNVMGAVDPIAKDRQGHGYKFRGVDDVYIALQAILSANGVFTTSKILSERSEERSTKSGGNLIYRIMHIEYTFWATDGSSVKSEVVGEAMDSSDKASNKAMSVAHKYALIQAFCIPTDEPKDPENDDHKLKGKHDSRQSFDTERGQGYEKKTRQGGSSRAYQDGQDYQPQGEDQSHGEGDDSSDPVKKEAPALFDKDVPADLVRLEQLLKMSGDEKHLEIVAKELHGLAMIRGNVKTILLSLEETFGGT